MKSVILLYTFINVIILNLSFAQSYNSNFDKYINMSLKELVDIEVFIINPSGFVGFFGLVGFLI